MEDDVLYGFCAGKTGFVSYSWRRLFLVPAVCLLLSPLVQQVQQYQNRFSIRDVTPSGFVSTNLRDAYAVWANGTAPLRMALVRYMIRSS